MIYDILHDISHSGTLMRFHIIPFAFLLLSGCITAWNAPTDFAYVPIDAGQYTLLTYQRLSDSVSPVHIYIEGDGNSFDSCGVPTSDPTPHGTLVRDMAAHDLSPNVVYMARPCQYIMSRSCRVTDWTDGRFSPDIIDAMAGAVRTVAQARPIVLIGYSGGALVSGIIINQNPDMNIVRWITVAGVLNHADWTEYFGDAPLDKSLNMSGLPDIPQIHYIAKNDAVVPNELSYKWTGGQNLTVVSNATHGKFPKKEIKF